MTRNEVEALAVEISASEGVSLPIARQIAIRELSMLASYAQDWDRMVAQMSPAQPYRVSAA